MAQSRHSLCSSLPFSSTFSVFRDINRQLNENCTCKDNVVYIIVRRSNRVKDAAPIISFPHIKSSFLRDLRDQSILDISPIINFISHNMPCLHPKTIRVDLFVASYTLMFRKQYQNGTLEESVSSYFKLLTFSGGK